MPEVSSLPEAFLKSAETYSGKPAFFYREGTEDKEITFGQFTQKAKSIAAWLKDNGIRPSDRVAIISPLRIEWHIAFTGIILSEAIAVPVNEMAPEAEIRAIFKDSAPALVFFGEETAHLKELFGTDKILDLGSPQFGEIFSRGAHFEKPERKNPDETAVILYTSGTTGLPKGVMLTHKNLVSDVEGILATGLVAPKENVLGALPLYHAYPLMGTLIAPFIAGASVTVLHSMKDLLSVVAFRKVSIIVAVPQMLELMESNLKKRIPVTLKPLLSLCNKLRKSTGINAGRLIFKKVHQAFGGKLDLLASGGARLSPEVMETLEGFGFTVVEGYGLTETSPVVTFNPLEKRKAGSVGKPLDHAQIRIQDGEVLINGPMVMKGYWHKPEETEKVLKEGWFYSGDLGHLDKDGYLFITGRKKEMIVLSSGKNISPEEVEKVYKESPLIKEIGVYDDSGSLKAVIVPDLDYAKEKRISNLNEAIGWELQNISQKLPSYDRLTGYALSADPLPKTSLGKIKRYKLKGLRAETPSERKPDPRIFDDPVGQKAARSIFEVLRRESPIKIEDNLELDLGFDSLKKLELLSALEEQFPGQKLPDNFLADVQTIGDLIEKLKTTGLKEEAPSTSAPFKEPGRLELALSAPLALLIKVLCRVLFRAEGKGFQNIPPVPFIFAPNHTSFLDAFVLAAVLPWHLLKELYFQGFFKFFSFFPLSLLGGLLHVIPIDTEAHLGSALRKSEEALKKSKALCIFPEGGRSYDGNLMELKKGIALLATKSGVPVVPVWIEGAHRALSKGSPVMKPVKIKVRFGKPLTPADYKNMEEFLMELRNRITALSRQEGGQ